MFVVAMVVGADLLHDDAGLITGLVIGVILVNRPPRGVEPRACALGLHASQRACVCLLEEEAGAAVADPSLPLGARGALN